MPLLLAHGQGASHSPARRANVCAQSFINKDGWVVKDFPTGTIKVPTLGIMTDDFALSQGQMKQSERYIEEPGTWR